MTTDRPRKPKSPNPLQAGIQLYLQTLPTQRGASLGIKQLPKRFTIYPPLLLLPANFASHSQGWAELYTSLETDEKQSLFQTISSAFGAQGVTQIASNSPIPAFNATDGTINVTRSPSGLSPLWGDFGPAHVSHGGESADAHDDEQPTSADFDRAFWVSTVQNDISQTWAPRWTMFSRGNIGEKTRILGEQSQIRGLTEVELGQGLAVVDVVDLYVGIGYFAYSYLKRGVRRVWGWELNGWSVEALVRGAARNEWAVSVVRVGRGGAVDPEVLAQVLQTDEARMVVFHGDNRWASSVMGTTRQPRSTPLLKGELASRG